MWTYRPALDGVRAVAVYLVLLFHAGLPWVAGGFVGVDLFFVLSGFLVSNVILDEVDRTGSFSLGGFYARRVRRLLPAAVLVVVVTAALFWVFASTVRRLPLISDAVSALLYYSNWHFLASANDYFASAEEPSPFLHFWSLSIEEQFYVVFPLLLLLIIRRRGQIAPPAGWERRLGIVVAVLFAASVIAQIWWAQVSVNHAYYGTDARLYQLLAGVGAAIWLRARVRADKSAPATATLAAMIGLAGLLVVSSDLFPLTPSWRGLGACAASLLLVLGLAPATPGWFGRLFAHKTPVYLGKISYGTYLWHWPVIVLLREAFELSHTQIAVLGGVLATALSALSYSIFEEPIRRTPRLARFRWSVVVVGLSMSVLAAFTAVPALLRSEHKPVRSTAAAGTQITARGPGFDVAVPQGIDWEKISDDVGTSRTCTAANTDECIVVRGNGPHIALIGDSHAKMYGDMLIKLAQDHDFTLSMNVVPGCGWTTGLVNLRVEEKTRQACFDAREKWYRDALPKLNPDVLLLVQKQRDDAEVWGKNLINRDGTKQSLPLRLQSATDRTIAELLPTGRKLLVMEGTMGAGNDRPLSCLSAAKTIGECAVRAPAQAPLSDSSYRLAAAKNPGQVYTVNVNPVVCPDAPLCLPMREGVAVWRDPDHLTVSFTLAHREEFWKALVASGAIED